MKTVVFALALSCIGLLGLTGCSSDSGGGETTPPPAGSGPGGLSNQPGQVVPGQMPGRNGRGANPVKATGVRSTFDTVPSTMGWPKGDASAGQQPMAGAPTGSKPQPIKAGAMALAARVDPFESMFKPVVQITPAWDFVINHRTQAQPTPATPEPHLTGDPNIDLPPLPPVPRRIAGVFYNGGITAIIESGVPPTSDITIVQPGAEVESGVPGVGPLIVESITMDSLILRARDGRTVEVKLSGLAPAVLEAMRQQFVNAQGGAQGGGTIPGARGSGGMAPGDAGGAGGAPIK